MTEHLEFGELPVLLVLSAKNIFTSEVLVNTKNHHLKALSRLTIRADLSALLARKLAPEKVT